MAALRVVLLLAALASALGRKRVYTATLAQIGTSGVSGDVVVFGDTTELAMIGTVSGLEPSLDAAGTDCAATNGCGVHVHSGTSCTDPASQGGHYYPAETPSSTSPWITDPWAKVRYQSTNASGDAELNIPQLTTGAYDIGGKVFIVHNSTGGRVACGVLTEVTDGVVSTVTSALLPGAPLARVTMFTQGQRVVFAGSASGLEPDLIDGTNCTAKNGCGVHVHKGKSCADAASQEGHYYDSAAIAVDPWLQIKYAPSSPSGNAAFIFRTEVGYAASGGADVDSWAFVVHNSAGVRTACGLLGRGIAPGKPGANHNFTIPDRHSMHARWFPCSARTNPTMGPKPKAASMATGVPVGQTRLGFPEFDPAAMRERTFQ